MQIGGRTYNVKLGFTIFLAITIVSAVVILYIDVDKNTWSSLKKVRLEYSLLAGILIITQWLLNGLRFQILVNSFEEKVHFGTSFNAFMANVFMSAMTPSQSGGGPLQIYVLNRAGIPMAKAFAGCLMGAVLTVTCIVISNISILIFKSSFRSGFGHHMGTVLTVVIATFTFLASLFLLSIFKINMIKRLFGKIILFLSHLFKSKRKYSITKKMIKGLEQYNECMLTFAKAKKLRILISGVLTMLCLCANSFIAPALLAGLNIRQNALNVFLLQFPILFISYFSPTPGGSGIAEFSNYWIMASVNIEQRLLGIYTVIWRFFTSFFGVGVGAIIVLGMLKSKRK